VILDSTRLGEAVAEMNRYSPIPLEIASPLVADLRISGAFRVDRRRKPNALLAPI